MSKRKKNVLIVAAAFIFLIICIFYGVQKNAYEKIDLKSLVELDKLNTIYYKEVEDAHFSYIYAIEADTEGELVKDICFHYVRKQFGESEESKTYITHDYDVVRLDEFQMKESYIWGNKRHEADYGLEDASMGYTSFTNANQNIIFIPQITEVESSFFVVQELTVNELKENLENGILEIEVVSEY